MSLELVEECKNKIDDIQLAKGASSSVGKLYEQGKAFSIETPVQALSFLRGLASAFCDCLDNEIQRKSLSEKIRDLNERGMLKSSVLNHLRILQRNGNKAAHPESYDFESLNFPSLVADALQAARGLIEHLYEIRHAEIPCYEVAQVESGALKEMCVRAMLDRDIEAINQAGEYFKERAEQQNENDSIIAADGFGRSSRYDIDQAMFWFKQGAEMEHPNCMYQYGCYISQQSHAADNLIIEGKTYITRAAEADHADAILHVALGHTEGSGFFVEDHVYARELLERAVMLGQPMAMAQLGAMCALGAGGDVDSVAAAHLTLQAARTGIPQGQFNLFVLYMNGNGLPQDQAEAIKWLIEAADQDYPEAIYNLATFIRAGLIHNRPPSDAEQEFERCMKYTKYRDRAALSLAEMISERSHELRDLVLAAKHVQYCYAEISSNGDPYALKKDCLEVSKIVVRLLRKILDQKGPDNELHGEDVFTSVLFDKNYVPYTNKTERIENVIQTLHGFAEKNKNHAGAEFLMQEACLNPSKASRRFSETITPFSNTTSCQQGKKLGRNELCYCGSKLKFKRCHGR